MGNALVVRKDQLLQSQTVHRAAQYVRIYTDCQQYSIETQAVVMQLTPNYIGPTAAKSASQVIRLGSLDFRVSQIL